MTTNKEMYDRFMSANKRKKELEESLEKIGVFPQYHQGVIGKFLSDITILYEHLIAHSMGIRFVYRTDMDIESAAAVMPSDKDTSRAITRNDFRYLMESPKGLWGVMVDNDPDIKSQVSQKMGIKIGMILDENNSFSGGHSDRAIYSYISRAVCCMLKMQTVLREYGININYEHGPVGKFMNDFIDDIKAALCFILHLHLFESDGQSINDVYYPDDNDYNFSILDDDLMYFIFHMDNRHLGHRLWNAIYNKDEAAKQEINEEGKIRIGPVE